MDLPPLRVGQHSASSCLGLTWNVAAATACAAASEVCGSEQGRGRGVDWCYRVGLIVKVFITFNLDVNFAPYILI